MNQPIRHTGNRVDEIKQINRELESLVAQLASLGLQVVPAGGDSGFMLVKASGDDYDTEWAEQPSITETDPTVPQHVKDITDTQIGNWDTAFGWGNHASAGYLTSESDPTVPAHVKAITATQIGNWDTAFGWGDHSAAGYLTGVATNSTQVGDGTTGSPLGVNVSHNFIWGGTHEFLQGKVSISDGPRLGTFAASLSIGRTWTMPNHTGDIPVVVAAGSSFSQAAVRYNGTTRASGRFYGGSTEPSSAARLNYDGVLWTNGFVMDADNFFSTGQLIVGGNALFLNSGAAQFGVPVTLQSAFRPYSGVLTPPTLTGDIHNYNPTGLADATVLRIDCGASIRNMTGLAGGLEGRVIVIQNIGTQTLNIQMASGSSSAANRFTAYTVATVAVPGVNKNGDPASAAFRYDGNGDRWRLMWEDT